MKIVTLLHQNEGSTGCSWNEFVCRLSENIWVKTKTNCIMIYENIVAAFLKVFIKQVKPLLTWWKRAMYSSASSIELTIRSSRRRRMFLLNQKRYLVYTPLSFRVLFSPFCPKIMFANSAFRLSNLVCTVGQYLLYGFVEERSNFIPNIQLSVPKFPIVRFL